MPQSPTPWTVLVWMAGDNDLESYALEDLDEIKRVGSGPGLTVVAQVDRMTDRGTRRYVLRRGTPLAEDVVADLGETNTGDPAVATDFFSWGIEAFPSRHVLAVIWNHGSGIDETDVYARVSRAGASADRGTAAAGVRRATARAALERRYRHALFSTTVDQAVADRGIAYDDTSRDFLDNAELKRVMLDVTRRAGRRIDLLGFDACLMNMIEIAYQLRTTVRFIVGSEQVEPGDGWPYDRVLSAIAARPDLSPREVGDAVVREYFASYADESVTQSLLDVDKTTRCADAVDALAAALLAVLDDRVEYGALARAFNRALRFEIEDFADLGSLCEEIGAALSGAEVRRAAAAVLDTIDGRNGLVAAEAHAGRQNARARGVSIYAPRRRPSTTYARLDFARQTKWNDLLEAMW
jgi:hypothetical protein